MGWLGTLGKILGVGGAAIAAPFTGGASLAGIAPILGNIGKVASAVSPVLGAMSGANKQSQREQEVTNLSRDQLNQNRYQLQQQGPGRRMQTSARAALAKAPPVKVNWGGPGSGLRGQKTEFTGGANTPGLFSSGDMGAMLDDIMHQNLLQQMQHGQDVPEVTGAPESGAMDKLIGGAATGAGLLGAVGTMLPRPKPKVPSTLPVPGQEDEWG